IRNRVRRLSSNLCECQFQEDSSQRQSSKSRHELFNRHWLNHILRASKRCPINPKNTETSPSVTLANGSSANSNGIVKFNIKIPSLSTSIAMPCQAVVLPHSSFPIILGMDFLTRVGAVIDLKQGTLTLANRTMNLTSATTQVKQHDSEIIKPEFDPNEL
ncbi:hypothetical protein ROZALSC1DRAFT_25955, partial [Rozella allomycis CSF55]